MEKISRKKIGMVYTSTPVHSKIKVKFERIIKYKIISAPVIIMESSIESDMWDGYQHF